MPDQVLMPVSGFDPWARAVANTVATIETPDTTTPLLVHVFDEKERKSAIQRMDLDSTLDPHELAEQKSAIEAAADVFDDAEFEYNVVGIESETPGRALLDIVDEADVDRVYMYGRKRSPVGKSVFGSQLQKVLANSPVPVVVLPADAALRSRNSAAND